MLEHGMIDLVVQRSDLRTTLARVLRLYSGQANETTGVSSNLMMVNA